MVGLGVWQLRYDLWYYEQCPHHTHLEQNTILPTRLSFVRPWSGERWSPNGPNRSPDALGRAKTLVT
jgi:hypothetical protein